MADEIRKTPSEKDYIKDKQPLPRAERPSDYRTDEPAARTQHPASGQVEPTRKAKRTEAGRDPANRDPITGEPGSHPVGTGIGAAAGGIAAGAAAGAIGGPLGAAIGAAVGAIAGGAIGHGVGEAVNPTEEEAYWRDNYKTRPYAKKDKEYDTYAPAYRTGYLGYAGLGASGHTYEKSEPQLKEHYEKNRGSSELSWDEASPAVRDAWERVEKKNLKTPPEHNPHHPSKHPNKM
jgi:uncharacterized protein YcfJ